MFSSSASTLSSLRGLNSLSSSVTWKVLWAPTNACERLSAICVGSLPRLGQSRRIFLRRLLRVETELLRLELDRQHLRDRRLLVIARGHVLSPRHHDEAATVLDEFLDPLLLPFLEVIRLDVAED